MKCFDCDSEMNKFLQSSNGQVYLCPKCNHISILQEAK